MHTLTKGGTDNIQIWDVAITKGEWNFDNKCQF